ncbi:VOC family protein [Chitinilyticum litopenaei]|uniref:VOC family protein n=1 Tax=Chitinilyticum litopenaei TaxID=1121276 RepID=UPI000418B46F|nr:VOC family protein [Chitinilyticum litopenaei]
MTVMNSYLNFPGTAEEAFTFYKGIFGGEFTTLMRYKDGPPREDGQPLPAEIADKILHVALPIGGNTLMASDAIPPMCPSATQGNHISLSLHPDSEEEGRRLFDALSAGGEVQMPYQPMFWGAVFGMCVDKFGIPWMVNYEQPKA